MTGYPGRQPEPPPPPPPPPPFGAAEAAHETVEILLKVHPQPSVIRVASFDDQVQISTWLLSENSLTINEDGNLVADTAGEYVYRPVRFAEQGRVVVCERVR